MKKAAEASSEKSKKQIIALRQELDDVKRELERRTQVDIDIDLLRQEKDRLAKKVGYLTVRVVGLGFRKVFSLSSISAKLFFLGGTPRNAHRLPGRTGSIGKKSQREETQR